MLQPILSPGLRARPLGRAFDIPPPLVDFDFVGRPSLTCPGVGTISFTRASTAYRVNASGLLESVGSGVARYGHDPLTGARLGLLIEESRTNLITRSEELDNAAWTKNNTTVTADAVISPDGTQNADRVDATSASSPGVQQAPTVSSGAAYTVSVFAKAGTMGFSMYRDFSNGITVVVNLTSGANSVLAGSATVVAQEFADDWWRFAITYTTSTTTATTAWRVCSDISGTHPSSGNIYLWGAQVEAGAFPTSYIKTTSATVTRAADLPDMDVGDWFNAAEGTLLFEGSSFRDDWTSVNNRMVSFHDGTNNNRMFISLTGSTGIVRGQADVSGSNTILTGSTAVGNSTFKAAFAYKANACALSVNSGAVTTDTSGAIPTVTKMQFGGVAGSVQLTGHLRRVSYWPYRMGNNMLPVITA